MTAADANRVIAEGDRVIIRLTSTEYAMLRHIWRSLWYTVSLKNSDIDFLPDTPENREFITRMKRVLYDDDDCSDPNVDDDGDIIVGESELADYIGQLLGFVDE